MLSTIRHNRNAEALLKYTFLTRVIFWERRERDRERMEREECVYVLCVCVRERKRERERENLFQYDTIHPEDHFS